MNTTAPAFGHPDPMMQPEFYASVPTKRLIAWVIDLTFSVILAAMVVPFTAFTGLFFFPFLVMVVGFAYRVVTITAGSATLGMRMMSIELRDARGQRFDFTQALLHTLGYSLSLSMFIVQVASIVLMLGSARGQSLTDLVMGSVMINRRA